MIREYRSVPVAEARRIAQEFHKEIVVIVAVDHVHDRTHFTTYGQGAENKQLAVRIADDIAKATGHSIETAVMNQDFRTAEEAAQKAAENEALRKLARACDHALSSLLAVRSGLTDEFLQTLQGSIRETLKVSV